MRLLGRVPVPALVVVVMSVGMVLVTVETPLERQGVSSAWSAWSGWRLAFGGTRTRSGRAGRSAGTLAWSVLVFVPMVLLVTLLTLTVVLLRAGVECGGTRTHGDGGVVKGGSMGRRCGAEYS